METKEIRQELNHIREEFKANQSRLSLAPDGAAEDNELETRLDRIVAALQELRPRTQPELEQRQRLQAMASGLHLRNGSLDRSHELSQHLDTQEGSYLHGLMHRMEGDFSNANYWFRLAGPHPQAKELQRLAVELAEGTPGADNTLLRKLKREPFWNAALFTDLAAASSLTGHRSQDTPLLEKLQSFELELLLEHLDLG
ncbi:hypothetical protein M3223_21450 [Paenibacillus pasadenensis]|uniref:hypothetical protein n=1 Tax=Paenibacillus pasadenensis TaxID=217090 RepID=UPI00203F1F12|nr:hypothetical protein [Paenibacillus pasadenensis]MCM3749904.1 hypothetical protein [Paenibacillus pasadenensis]